MQMNTWYDGPKLAKYLALYPMTMNMWHEDGEYFEDGPCGAGCRNRQRTQRRGAQLQTASAR